VVSAAEDAMAVGKALQRAKLRGSVLLLGCGAAALVPGSDLPAQVLLLRPVADVSLPTRFSLKNGSIHIRQKVGLTLGARMTVTFNNRFDVITTVTYSPGYATIQAGGKRVAFDAGTHSLGGSAGARYWIHPPGGKLSWELSGGVGMVFGGQPTYEDLFESSTVSGVLGSTWVYQVGRIVSLKLKLQERLFRLRFGMPNSGSSKRPLQLSFGLGLPFLDGLKPAQ
jgi:hypothetical protein